MKKILFNLLLGFCIVSVLSVFQLQYTEAQRIPVLEFYHTNSCSHCRDEIKWFAILKKQYPDVQIQQYEIADRDNYDRMQKRLKELGKTYHGTPVNIIGNDVVNGFNPDAILQVFDKNFGPSTNKKKELLPNKELDIKKNSHTNNMAVVTAIDGSGEIQDEEQRIKNLAKGLNSTLGWSLMSFVLGIIDGFNPCAMWTLMVLLGFLFSIDDVRKRWLIGGVFIISSAIIYFVALCFYVFVFEQFKPLMPSSIPDWINGLLGIVALLFGLYLMNSSRKAEIDCTVRDAASKKKFAQTLQKILNRKNILFVLAGIIVIAFSVNFVELLCSWYFPVAFSWVMVTIVEADFYTNLAAILIYDLAYVFDDILVFSIAMVTMNYAAISPKWVQASHLIGGLLLVGGGFMLMWISFLSRII